MVNMKIILISILLGNCILAISMKNIISLWYLMELESLIFILFLMKNKNPSKSPIIYFIVGFISSILILTSVYIQNEELSQFTQMMNFIQNQSNLLSLAFLIKMSAAPFHVWSYQMMDNMEWLSMAILLTIQKIIPIWALMLISEQKFIFMIMIFSLAFSIWLPLNSKNSFFLLATSSVMNNIWIILISLNSSINTMSYTIMYFLVTLNLIFLMKSTNSKSTSLMNPISIMISMLSIMGFPPLPLFFMKLMAIKNLLLTQTSLLYFAILIVITNMISSIMYLKFTINSVMMMKNSNNWKKMPIESNILFLSLIISQISISIFISSA